jgi:hypothetical protein
MSAVDASLDAQYRRSLYLVHDGEVRIETRIDLASPPLAALLARHGVAQAALLSACNPDGQRLPAEHNLARQGAFETELRQAGLRFLPALGRSPEGDWQEPAVLLLDADEQRARDWAVRRGQLAWVQYDRYGRGTLRYVGATSP